MSGSRQTRTHERLGAWAYEALSSASESSTPLVIPDGDRWHVRRFIGNAAYTSSVRVTLYWDRGGPAEVIMASTHGDADLPLDFELLGDGIKAVEIVLVNASNRETVIGASWEGVEL